MRYESKSYKDKKPKEHPALDTLDASKIKTVADVKEVLEVIVEALKTET